MLPTLCTNYPLPQVGPRLLLVPSRRWCGTFTLVLGSASDRGETVTGTGTVGPYRRGVGGLGVVGGGVVTHDT